MCPAYVPELKIRDSIPNVTIADVSSPVQSRNVPSSGSGGSQDAKHSNLGAIIGGVVGGIGGFIILSVVVVFFWRRRSPAVEDDGEKIHLNTYSVTAKPVPYHYLPEEPQLSQPISNAIAQPAALPAGAGIIPSTKEFDAAGDHNAQPSQGVSSSYTTSSRYPPSSPGSSMLPPEVNGLRHEVENLRTVLEAIQAERIATLPMPYVSELPPPSYRADTT